MPIPSNLRQLEYAIAVADFGSTAAAARAIHVSQPSVSLAIGMLEQHFGQPLFQRIAGQGLQPTSFGRVKIPEFRRLLSHADTVLGVVSGDVSAYRLTLGVFSTLAPVHIPRLMRLFTERYPGSQVRLLEHDLQGLVDGLSSGLLDLAVLYDVGLPADLTVVKIREVRPYALVPEGHRLATRSVVALADLLQDPLILINLPHSREFFLSIARLGSASVTIAAEAASIEMARSMVANGMGVSLLATDIPYSQTYDGRSVVRLEISEDIPVHRIVVAHSSKLPVTESTEAFIDLTIGNI